MCAGGVLEVCARGRAVAEQFLEQPEIMRDATARFVRRADGVQCSLRRELVVNLLRALAIAERERRLGEHAQQAYVAVNARQTCALRRRHPREALARELEAACARVQPRR